MLSPSSEYAERVRQKRIQYHNRIVDIVLNNIELKDMILEASRYGYICIKFAKENGEVKIISTGL